MEEQSIQQFTRKMLEEKVFNCASCEDLLKVPVMIVEAVGNVCNECFIGKSEEKMWKGIANVKLNLILQELKFPCKYESVGCNKELMYGDLVEHQEKCDYRIVNCVLFGDDCEWKGELVNLPDHFKEEHSNDVVNSTHDIFNFEVNFKQWKDITKMLKTRNKTYIIDIKYDEDGNLVHFIRDIRSDSATVQMIIKYIGENDQYKIKTNCFPFITDYEVGKGTKVRVLTLSEMAQPNGSVLVLVKPCKYNLDNVNQQVAKYLECPICQELMRPPICQCSAGHSVCSTCRSKLKYCPTCRQAWGNTRNFCLEGITLSVQYPCVNSQFGCNVSLLGGEINQHEGICEYKIYSCPVCNNFRGNYNYTDIHFKQNHKDDLADVNVKSKFLVPDVEGQDYMFYPKQKKYRFEYGNIFQFIFTRTMRECRWVAKILNDYNKSYKYSYTIAIFDVHCPERKIVKSNLISVPREANPVPITFTYDELKTYVNPQYNEITYFCKITEIR